METKQLQPSAKLCGSETVLFPSFFAFSFLFPMLLNDIFRAIIISCHACVKAV